MFKDFIRAMFYVPASEGTYRISLTKMGSAVKSFALYIGGSLAALTYFGVDTKAGVIVGVSSAVITGLGNWIEEVGKRNAQ